MGIGTFRRVKRDDVVAPFYARDAFADVHDDASTFMPENCGEQALRIGAGERELVGMANTGRFDLD